MLPSTRHPEARSAATFKVLDALFGSGGEKLDSIHPETGSGRIAPRTSEIGHRYAHAQGSPILESGRTAKVRFGRRRSYVTQLR
ncbi:hypothetical protein PROAA_1680010 [Candidatus Propionivibrio aalborgensis]|uniref:Uncharacterized protein n=1 Tax=Candidatus Propionivibrio aalborgensis TaxID=1860101 RepID=A0A1A8XMC9_9RHOO|nr:hypothetical protein [Candidatus Propionivibrio aalborgensis]MBK9026960.1 hypothetical protein [Propionivibrio sp.]SBT05816.1 hypothetical protein PROAA_1680010 [Candidatus Propionivibrio aalborgensis]